jgi:hypothetical protein
MPAGDFFLVLEVARTFKYHFNDIIFSVVY